MHTSKHENITFHHNGDYEGEVIILGANVVETEYGPEVRIDFAALKSLVADYVRANAIRFYESAEPDDVLRSFVDGKVVR